AHPNVIGQWKKELIERAGEIFSKDKKEDAGPEVKELHAKIGQLTMENDFFAVALGRVGKPSARK
ncbi:MAG TPA: IS3 family transposase, partial [Dissulfurispiraceae bacterium]|nr:IS3 family transposase [Dissulfurispiraceae bacterium]